MSKKFKKICLVLMTCILCFTVIGCSESNYTGDVVHFSSSDEKLADFLNDFTRRNLRYDDQSISGEDMPLASGTGFAKNWETMGLAWHNSSGNVLGEDKQARLKNFLQTISQDDYGMIYNTHNNLMPGMSVAGEGVSQGWPFPTHNNSGGRSTAFEFNYESEKEKWTPSSGATFSVGTDGYARFSYNAKEAGDAFSLVYNDITPLTLNGAGVDAKHAPMLEIELSYTDFNNAIGTGTDVEDIYIVWKTAAGGDVWYEASYSDYATTAPELTYAFAERLFFPMYLNKNWDGQLITSIGFEIRPKEGKKLNIQRGRVNYIRLSYDTRQSNATSQFLLALDNYISATNDTEFFVDIMPKARKALMFLAYGLDGRSGLVDISFMYGHNGIGWSASENGRVRNLGDGIGNGYWDIITAPEVNLEANTYFYQGLGVLARLEQRLIDAGHTGDKVEKVKNRTPGGDKISYEYDVKSLLELQQTVKENIEKDCNVVKMPDGTYKNKGGLWNPETERFFSGIRKDTGALIDYGFTYFNLETLAAGIGTAEQRNLVMSWLNGDRIIEGDDSTGDDIYFYEFAPRFSTKANIYDYGFYYTSPGYSKQVQDGGAVICWSYYDLVSRIDISGTDDAFKRLKNIQSWYEKVQEAGGEGSDFYSDYYMYLETGDEKYVLQQSGAQNGAMGLDTEFLESIILSASIPYGFFGMDGGSHNTMSFTNKLPSDLKYLQIDNMSFSGMTYSVRMEKNSFVIKNVRGSENDCKLKLNFAKPKGNYKVKINGKETSDYKVVNDVVTVTVPFDNVEVLVK